MTITNFSATRNQGTVVCNWTSSEDYSFLYQDAEVIASLPLGDTRWSGPYVTGAVYQAVDSATSTPVPLALEPQPRRYIDISWVDLVVADVSSYEVYLDSRKVSTRTAGNGNYTYSTPRLDGGVHELYVLAVDNAGNRLATVSEFTYELEDQPNPVRSSILTQSGAGNITLTLIEPSGWPTV